MTSHFARLARVLPLPLALAAACQSANDRFLGVENPNIITTGDIQNADGAVALANGVLGSFRNITGAATTGTESSWMFGGLLADEWSTSSTFIQNDETDQRRIQLFNASVTEQLRNLYRVRTRANEAIAALNKYSPGSKALLAEIYLARGYAELQLASDFCNGIPIAATTGGTPPENGTPKSTKEVFTLAAASLDSSIAIASGTDAQSVLINRAARVARGRTALALGDFANAATFVGGVPTSFAYQHTFSLTTSSNTLWGQGISSRRYSVGDSIEGNARNIFVKNALPFASSKDPRVPTTIPTSGAINGQDGLTYARTTTLWGQLTPVDVANGIDARLIESEVALKNGNVSQWLGILNALRAAPPKLGDVQPAAMPPLTDPGSDSARVSLQFREKAFWTFGRGQRLGDLRRLIRQYGRTQDNVFPVGVHYKGGTYGTDVNLPVVTAEENNPNFKGCTDRNA
jgi:starch-binding outer membrane protein, SusD/RagB family